MLDFIINSLIWILALYGFSEIVRQIINICTCTNLKADGIYMVIAAKNQEEKVEGFIRSILFRLIYGKDEIIKNIIVTDLESNDNTKVILKKLEKDHEYIKFLEWNDCKEVIENIKSVENN